MSKMVQLLIGLFICMKRKKKDFLYYKQVSLIVHQTKISKGADTRTYSLADWWMNLSSC